MDLSTSAVFKFLTMVRLFGNTLLSDGKLLAAKCIHVNTIAAITRIYSSERRKIGTKT